MTERKTRHPDFARLLNDFVEIRGSLNGPILYLRFLEEYGLDERISYDLTAQKRLREMALKSRKHLAIKAEYPQIDWDAYILGVRRIGKHLKMRSDHPVKLRVRGLAGRRLNIRLGGGEY